MNVIRKLSTGLIALVLLLSLVGSTAPSRDAVQAKAQPLLTQLAAENPEQRVAVIVQKLTKDNQVEARVERLGGMVTNDLHIINAFAAEMSAEAALELACDPQVRWVSLDAPVVASDCSSCIDTTNLQNAYIHAIGANRVWNEAPYNQGQGIGVAIVDSGVAMHNDFRQLPNRSSPTRIIAAIYVGKANTSNNGDYYGHGTHVAGIVGGNGFKSSGAYIGVAPKVNLISVKVSDAQGIAKTSTVVEGLQWVLDNATTYNIRVVNLSLNSSVAESYHTNPIDAAVEILWFNKIIVVVSAGNTATGLHPPANDPFVITVGAVNLNSTPDISDDTLATYSAYGITEAGFSKPDLVAPGKDIISTLSSPSATIYRDHPSNRVDAKGRDQYFRISGTSVAAPVVAGAVALLLQDEPNLTPDQVKYRLMATANKDWLGYDATQAGAGYLDIYAAVHGTTTESANTEIAASQLLWSGPEPITWNSVSWNSVSWNSVSWNSVSWNSVSWNSVSWNSTYWGP